MMASTPRSPSRETWRVHAALLGAGLDVPPDDVATLRRAAQTLRTWFLWVQSGHVWRDKVTGRPCAMLGGWGGEPERLTYLPEREDGARRRIHAVCHRLGLSHYVKRDRRGATLYLARVPLNPRNYRDAGTPVI